MPDGNTPILPTYSVFPECPGRDLGKAFMEHIRQTSRPESFPMLSRSKPPEHGELRVLSDPINLNRKLRGDAGAPCPICSGSTPKWLYGGRLIWCAATRAIYCIGPMCNKTCEVRLTQATNVYDRTERAIRNAEDLAAAVRVAPARLDWIEAARPEVRRVEDYQNELAEKLPHLRRRIHRDVKGGAVRGAGFLKSRWRAADQFDSARAAISATMGACTEMDPDQWAAHLAPSDCERLIGVVEGGVDILKLAKEHVDEAAAFLTADTVHVLDGLSRSYMNADAFEVEHVSARVILTAAKGRWSAPVGFVKPLPPIPGVD